MDLNGSQRRKLSAALLSAFPNPGRLARLVDEIFEERLDHIAMGENLEDIVFKLIQWAEMENQLDRLISEAYKTAPRNVLMRAFATDLGLPLIEPVQRETPPQKNLTPPKSEKERAAADAIPTDAPLYPFHLVPVVSPIAQYDHFFERLAAGLETWNSKPMTFRQTVLGALAQAARAPYACLAELNDNHWEIVAQNVTDGGDAEEAQTIDTIVRELLRQAYEYGTDPKNTVGNNFPHVTNGYLRSSGLPCLTVIRRTTQPPVALVLYNITKLEIEPDAVLAAALTTLLEVTNNLAQPPVTGMGQIEMALYESLHSHFGYVSRQIYDKQYKLFTAYLELLTIVFEPTIFLTRQPYIYSWEALARDPATGKAPEDLFKIAEHWGPQFLLELDSRLLAKSIDCYLDRGEERRHARAEELQELSVNVYPDSLLQRVYRERIEELEHAAQMPLNKLVLEISEKLPLPLSQSPQDAVSDIEWFYEQLGYYKNKQIRFAIDDFGVGYASTALLSRLGTAIVKIDRDALLHSYGESIFEYVINQSKQLGHDQRVVVEGLDIFSQFSLATLYKLGVRYVQGHQLGMPSAVIDRLPIDVQNAIRTELWDLPPNVVHENLVP